MIVIMVMVMIVAMVVIVIIVIVMVMPMVIVISIVIMPVVWDVLVVVPVVLHEVDGPAASVVLRAMLTPMFFVSRRNVEVDRLGRGILRRLRNHDRLRIDHWRPWSIADVNLPVEPRLTDADGYADLGKCGGCNGGPQENCVDCFVHMSVQARSGPPLRLKSGHKVTDCNWTGAERGGIKSHAGRRFLLTALGRLLSREAAAKCSNASPESKLWAELLSIVCGE